MNNICEDNRFEIIASYKEKLIKATNIEMCPEEMAVIDNILFRFWQMGWLDKSAMKRLTSKKPMMFQYGLYNDDERKLAGLPTSQEIYNKLKEYEDAEEARAAIEMNDTLISIIPHTCECCIGCELEQRCGSCNSFVLSPERAKEYLYYLARKEAYTSKNK